MRKILTLAMLLVTTSALAAPPECYEAIAKSKAVRTWLKERQGINITEIKQIRANRCILCFDFKLTMEKDGKESATVFSTEGSLSQREIIVRWRKDAQLF
ncbi:MAG: hypothetical protein V4534_07370 [Myxococcota bacterium]